MVSKCFLDSNETIDELQFSFDMFFYLFYLKKKTESNYEMVCELLKKMKLVMCHSGIKTEIGNLL